MRSFRHTCRVGILAQVRALPCERLCWSAGVGVMPAPRIQAERIHPPVNWCAAAET